MTSFHISDLETELYMCKDRIAYFMLPSSAIMLRDNFRRRFRYKFLNRSEKYEASISSNHILPGCIQLTEKNIVAETFILSKTSFQKMASYPIDQNITLRDLSISRPWI
jgi:hypothetical protein